MAYSMADFAELAKITFIYRDHSFKTSANFHDGVPSAFQQNAYEGDF